MEIRALIEIQNHRPVPGSMHTRLWLKGLAQLDNDLWVLTDKGEAIITGERRWTRRDNRPRSMPMSREW
jgi:hypothetical protein